MRRLSGHAVVLLLPAFLAGVVLAVPVPVTVEPIKDRKAFIPYRKYEPLPGKVVGVLVANVVAVMGQDGRSGPPDAIAFSRNAGSYRWVYTPTEANALITNLQVQVGEKGQQVKVYPKLNMANAKNLAPWKVEGPVALVEVEVNDGLGAPADEGFVATKMRRLDRTKEFPFDLPKVIADLRKTYAEHQKSHQAAWNRVLADARKKWLKDRQPTGPRETQELFYVTWLADKNLLRVHFRTRISDGAYTEVDGGADINRLPPLRRGWREARRPPPPPPGGKFRTGTTFGVEFGVAYEVAIDGEVVRILELLPEAFGQELPIPPGASSRR